MGANTRFLSLSLSLTLFAAACGGDDDETCDPIARTGCSDGKVCEQVQDGEPACFAPVEVHGRVLDLATDGAVANARVVAIDVNGGAASSVSVSQADGTYSLPVPAVRSAEGTPAAFPVTLRADAAGYQTFPAGARVALPLDVGAATLVDGKYVLASTLTDIGLLGLEAPGAGSLTGTVEMPDDGAGVLVVAESNGKGYSAVADLDGDYKIFNLPAGPYIVTAYARGHVYTAAQVDVTAEATADLDLTADAAGSLTGTVSIVDAPGGSTTSVVVFVESTFDPVTGRGVTPPGLRAPETGVPNVTNAFTMEGVPPGRYVVVAAFENDGLVRDPDRCIAGTADVHVEVAAGTPTTLDQTFKITAALEVMSPGATAAELVSSAPMLAWKDDASEDNYLVEVFDTFGQLVWSTEIPGTNGTNPQVQYAGPMEPGMYYQWRATSRRQSNCNISRTEDLRGVFFTP